jgi:hypothetical protein
MTSPYLDQPLRPLAVALPQMLEKIEAELPAATGRAEKQWLRQRAELIRGLLAPRQSPGMRPLLSSVDVQTAVLIGVGGALTLRGRIRLRAVPSPGTLSIKMCPPDCLTNP